MLTETHLVFMQSLPIANSPMIVMLFTLHSRRSCGWRSTAMIPCTKVITCTCIAMARPYKERQVWLQLLKQDTKIKTVLFIYLKHLQSFMVFGRALLCVNVYTKCSCSSAIP